MPKTYLNAQQQDYTHALDELLAFVKKWWEITHTKQLTAAEHKKLDGQLRYRYRKVRERARAAQIPGY